MTLETVKADFVERVGMCWCLMSETQNLTDNWTGTSIFSVVFSLCIYARLVYSTVNSFTRNTELLRYDMSVHHAGRMSV